MRGQEGEEIGGGEEGKEKRRREIRIRGKEEE